MEKYNREELIELCRNSIVPCSKWNDRDSCSAQQNIQNIYEGLTGGVEYTYNIECETIYIDFEPATTVQKANMLYINVDSREDYCEWYLSEYGEDFSGEMFEGRWIDWDENNHGYLPTKEKLEEADGEDWY